MQLRRSMLLIASLPLLGAIFASCSSLVDGVPSIILTAASLAVNIVELRPAFTHEMT